MVAPRRGTCCCRPTPAHADDAQRCGRQGPAVPPPILLHMMARPRGTCTRGVPFAVWGARFQHQAQRGGGASCSCSPAYPAATPRDAGCRPLSMATESAAAHTVATGGTVGTSTSTKPRRGRRALTVRCVFVGTAEETERVWQRTHEIMRRNAERAGLIPPSLNVPRDRL